MWKGQVCLQHWLKRCHSQSHQICQDSELVCLTWGTELCTPCDLIRLSTKGNGGKLLQLQRRKSSRGGCWRMAESCSAPTQPAWGLEMLQLAPRRKEQQTTAVSAVWAKHGGSRASGEPCHTAVPSELQWHLLCAPLPV